MTTSTKTSPLGADVRGAPIDYILTLAFAAIVVWTTLVNLPFFHLEESDDAFYTLVAHFWTQGLPPYVSAFDVKAPGFFAILALAQLCFGPSLATLKFVSILFASVASCSIFAIGRRYSVGAAVVCAVLYPALSEMCGDVAYEALNAFVLLAVLATLSSMSFPRRAILAGFAIGAACSIKQTAALDGLAVLAILLARAAPTENRWKGAGAFVVCAAVAPMAFALYFATIGDFDVFWQDVAWIALSRPSAPADSISFGQGFKYLALHQLLLTPVTIAVLFAIFKARTLAGRFPLWPLTVWLGAVVLSILIQHAVSRYYIAPAVAPLLLIATLGLAFSQPDLALRTDAMRLAKWPTSMRGGLILTLFGGVTLGFATLVRGAPLLKVLTPVDHGALAGVTSAILATHPDPNDRLYVVNSGPWANLTTGLAPPSAYFHRFHLLCDFPGAGLPKLKADMDALPRYVVINARAISARCELPSHWAVVNGALDASYRLAATATGAADAYKIYERR
jgi:Dolichyl-phosphate-mannose-protein mannosyltransferase